MIHDRQNEVSGRGLLLGTCNGLAQQSGVAAPVVRVAAVIALCVWFKLAVLLYCGGAIYYRLQR